MVLYAEKSIEEEFRSFVISSGYVHGDLTKCTTVALKEYIDKRK